MLQELKRLGDEIRTGMSEEERQALVARFDDPVATKASWMPMRRGGSNFATHTLHRLSPTRLEVRASGKAKLFYGVFLGIIGVAWPLSLGVALQGSLVAVLLVLVLGLGFVALAQQLRRRSVFDTALGVFWTGPGAGPQRAQDAQQDKEAVPLQDVYALQLIAERVSQGSSSRQRGRHYHRVTRSFVSVELNVVRRDGSRVHVMDHADDDQVRTDARMIAQLLNIPIWDATSPLT